VVAVYFSDKFCRFLDKILGDFGEFFFPSVNSTNFAICGKIRQFFDITKLEGKKKKNQKPCIVVYKTGSLVVFFFFFSETSSESKNCPHTPGVYSSLR
jgi:hypothetical protein